MRAFQRLSFMNFHRVDEATAREFFRLRAEGYPRVFCMSKVGL